MSTNEHQLPEQGFLESLTHDERAALQGLGEELNFEEGETVIEEATAQDHLYVLLSGRCKVLQKIAAREQKAAAARAAREAAETKRRQEVQAAARAARRAPRAWLCCA